MSSHVIRTQTNVLILEPLCPTCDEYHDMASAFARIHTVEKSLHPDIIEAGNTWISGNYVVATRKLNLRGRHQPEIVRQAPLLLLCPHRLQYVCQIEGGSHQCQLGPVGIASMIFSIAYGKLISNLPVMLTR